MKRASQGFTLIEMVVAFAILGLSLTVLYSTFESALRRVRHDEHLSEATLLAQSVLARAGTEWPLDQTSRHGEWQEYAYELNEESRSSRTIGPEPTLPTTRVLVSVSWPEASGRRGISLSMTKLLFAAPP